MSKSFRSGSKSKSASTNFISLHFNKADEDQLEISYVDKKETDHGKDEAALHSSHISEEKLKRETENPMSKSLGEMESLSSLFAEESNTDNEVAARQVQSDLDLNLERKSASRKDFKDKFSKTIEEEEKTWRNSCDGDYRTDHNKTPTETYLHLSPAIEASEVKQNTSVFENYIDEELSKCEIINPSLSKKNTDFKFSMSTLANQKQKLKEECDHSIEDSVKQPENQPTQSDKTAKPALLIKHYYHFVRTYWDSIFFRIVIVAVAILFVPCPSWIKGFITGAVLSGYIVYIMLKPGKPKEPFVMPDYSQLPPSNIPVSKVEDEHIIYKGWMNELPSELNYNSETYHVNCTKSIYIRLDGSYLRISYPQANIPKRAIFNEPKHDMQFIYQQHYDITGSTVELLPVGLTRKRLWSKKYPICLRIPNTKPPAPNTNKDSNKLFAKTTSRKDTSPFRRHNPRINDYNEVLLHLFSRTDRDKDLWFYRFKKASRLKLLKSHMLLSSPNLGSGAKQTMDKKRTTSIDLSTLHFSSDTDEEDVVDNFTDLSMTRQEKFELYMNQLLVPAPSERLGDRGSLMWLNVLIGRLFFDFLMEDVWAKLVTEKIQKKLSKLKLPAFLNELSVKDIHLGSALPKIHRSSEPCIDQKGLWVDVDLSYNGSFKMTLETKINVMGKNPEEIPTATDGNPTVDRLLRSPVYNSDEEDSAESSTDEELPLPEINEVTTVGDGSVPGGRGKKLLRFVDRLAQSTYFQNAAKNKFIQKAMKDISNMPLVLTVEVQWLTGTLAINIPPIPTDRLWYGFRTNPHLSIVARPKLGQRVVTLTHITDWIEKKLVLEFQKILVMPNMDDLVIPIMLNDTDLT